MKQISIWAKANQVKARLIIVIIHLGLALLGILAGWLLFKTNLIISAYGFYPALLVYILAFFVYPQHRGSGGFKVKKKIYLLQKSCDFTLAFCAFCMICFISRSCFSNDSGRLSSTLVNQVSASRGKDSTAEEIIRSLKYRSGNALTRPDKKILKHEFFKQLKFYIKAKAKGNNLVAAKAILIIITIVAAVGLAYLLAALACSLVCSGAEGLAVLVTIVGLAGIIIGSITLIRAILRMSKKKLPESQPGI